MGSPSFTRSAVLFFRLFGFLFRFFGFFFSHAAEQTMKAVLGIGYYLLDRGLLPDFVVRFFVRRLLYSERIAIMPKSVEDLQKQEEDYISSIRKLPAIAIQVCQIAIVSIVFRLMPTIFPRRTLRIDSTTRCRPSFS